MDSGIECIKEVDNADKQLVESVKPLLCEIRGSFPESSLRKISYTVYLTDPLMEACSPLNEYAWLVEAIRRHKKTMKDLEAAIDAAIDEMSDDFSIKRFLMMNKAEVKGMFLTEYDQEKVLEQAANDERRQTAMDMLRDGKPLDEIKRYS